MADEGETEDLEALERERLELLKSLEAAGEEDGEIADEDEEVVVVPQKSQSQSQMPLSAPVAVPVPVPPGVTVLTRKVPSPSTATATATAEAEPVSDGELEDEPETQPEVRIRVPAQGKGKSELKRNTPPVDRRQSKEYAPSNKPVKATDNYEDDDWGDPDSYMEPPPSETRSRPAPRPSLLPTPTQRYDHRPQLQLAQSQISGSTFKAFDDESWDEPPPASRPKLNVNHDRDRDRVDRGHSHSPIEDEEYDWGDATPTPISYPPSHPQHTSPRDTNTRLSGTGPGIGGRYRPPAPAPSDRDQSNWNSNSSRSNYNSWNQGPNLGMNMNSNQNQYSAGPAPPPPPNNNSNSGGGPALTGRALWAQRALELDKLNPLGDFKDKKNKGKEKPKPNWQGKPNQPQPPVGVGAIRPGLGPIHRPQIPPKNNFNLNQSYQRRPPQVPQPQPQPQIQPPQNQNPPMNNWMINTYKNTLGSSCDDENWDEPPLPASRPPQAFLQASHPHAHAPMPSQNQHQNQWHQHQQSSHQTSWAPPPPPTDGSTTPMADENEDWGNEPDPAVAVAVAPPPPPPLPPAPTPPAAPLSALTPMQMANTSTSTSTLSLTPSIPDSSPSSPISYPAYANLIGKLLHWYGFTAPEVERLLNAPNLFRVKYEQLTVHLSKNESDLEQCFKVIGSDHEAYYKEGREAEGLIEWRRNVSGDVWGTAAPKPGPMPPSPPSNPGNSLRAILKPSNQQATTAESRFYFPRPILEPQNEQLELLTLETRTQQDQFNPANATLPYQVFLEYGSFSDGISHEITRFRFIEYVAQVNGQGKDLLASVVSAYGMGAGGWPAKVKEWLEMRHGAFKRVQVQNGPPMNIPLHQHSHGHGHHHQQQQQQQPPLPLPLSTPSPTPTSVPIIPNYPSSSTSSLPVPRQSHSYQTQNRAQPSRPPVSAPPPPSLNLHQHQDMAAMESPTPTISFDHFQRLYTVSNPSIYSTSAIKSAYSEFCKFSASKYQEYVQSLSFWFPGVGHDEVERLVRGCGGWSSSTSMSTPTPTPIVDCSPVPRNPVPPPAPVLNGVPSNRDRTKSRASSSCSGSASGSTSSRSKREKIKGEKPILVTSKTAFRAAYKRRADINIKPELPDLPE